MTTHWSAWKSMTNPWAHMNWMSPHTITISNRLLQSDLPLFTSELYTGQDTPDTSQKSMSLSDWSSFSSKKPFVFFGYPMVSLIFGQSRTAQLPSGYGHGNPAAPDHTGCELGKSHFAPDVCRLETQTAAVTRKCCCWSFEKKGSPRCLGLYDH